MVDSRHSMSKMILVIYNWVQVVVSTHLPVSVLGRALRVNLKRLAERNGGLHFKSFVQRFGPGQ